MVAVAKLLANPRLLGNTSILLSDLRDGWVPHGGLLLVDLKAGDSAGRLHSHVLSV